MIMTTALTSSIADCWETPRALFEALDSEFGFRLFRGRIRFGGSSAGAPFPSALAVFRPGHRGPPILSAIATSGEVIR